MLSLTIRIHVVHFGWIMIQYWPWNTSHWWVSIIFHFCRSNIEYLCFILIFHNQCWKYNSVNYLPTLTLNSLWPSSQSSTKDCCLVLRPRLPIAAISLKIIRSGHILSFSRVHPWFTILKQIQQKRNESLPDTKFSRYIIFFYKCDALMHR